MALGEVRLLLSPECLQAGCGYPGIKLLSGCLEQQPRWTPAGMEEILGIADPTQGSCLWLETNPGGLATRLNKKRRNLEREDTRAICGAGPETAFNFMLLWVVGMQKLYVKI